MSEELAEGALLLAPLFLLDRLPRDNDFLVLTAKDPAGQDHARSCGTESFHRFAT